MVQSGFADNIGMTSVTLSFGVSSCFFPFLFNSLDFRYQLLLCGKIELIFRCNNCVIVRGKGHLNQGVVFGSA